MRWFLQPGLAEFACASTRRPTSRLTPPEASVSPGTEEQLERAAPSRHANAAGDSTRRHLSIREREVIMWKPPGRIIKVQLFRALVLRIR
jgi:hypothetical protein